MAKTQTDCHTKSKSSVVAPYISILPGGTQLVISWIWSSPEATFFTRKLLEWMMVLAKKILDLGKLSRWSYFIATWCTFGQVLSDIIQISQTQFILFGQTAFSFLWELLHYYWLEIKPCQEGIYFIFFHVCLELQQ